jgi:putative Mn2+ efflux pump MntP
VPLLLLALGISLDELALGFSAGLLGLPVVPALALIAAQAFAFSQLGLRLGARIGERGRNGAGNLAGVVLVGLGAVLLLERVV